MKKNSTLHVITIAVILLMSFAANAQLIYTGADININNVSATISNINNHFWDPVTQVNHYEVPQGSGLNTIYAGGPWIGGYDTQGNLHVAMQTYSQQGFTGFWPGPLDTTNGTAANPNVWNQIWKVNKSTVQNHIANWNTPGYIVPPEIANWPGNAPVGSNFNPVLAPFFDSNNNAIYEPALGEFPYIYGDQEIYFINNDNYAPQSTGVPAMIIEVHGMAFEFSDPANPFLNNTVFMRYQIKNRSGVQYNNVYAGLWTDIDLGWAGDDYFGTDVARNMVYGYNGDSFDDTSSWSGGHNGYGANPPAQGLVFLNTTLSHSQYYINANAIPFGNPTSGEDYYQYLTSTWLDGLPVTFGGDGRNQGNPPANYFFPGTTDPSFPGQDWNNSDYGPPTDIRGIGSVGPITLAPGGVITLDVAYVTAFGSSGPTSSVTLLQEYADSLIARYANGSITGLTEVKPNNYGQLTVYPNPVHTNATVYFNNPESETYALSVVDMSGKQVMSRTGIKNNSYSFNCSTLSTGVYLVQLKSQHTLLQRKMIVK